MPDSPPDPMTPDELRAALDTLGWSQAEAARQLGAANRQTVQRWASGRVPVNPLAAAHLGTLLELRLERRLAGRIRDAARGLLDEGGSPEETPESGPTEG